MAYTLTYCGGGSQQSITDPDFRDIAWAVQDLMPLMYHYAILEDAAHEEGNLYLQTRMIQSKDRKRLGYILETRFCPGKDGSGQDFAHYRMITEDEQLVVHHFKQYFMGKSVDVTGWEDITARMKKGAV